MPQQPLVENVRLIMEEELDIELASFEDRMISMSTYNDTEPQFIACFCVCRMFSKNIEHLSHQATKKCTATLPVRQRRMITIPEAKWCYWDHGHHQYCFSKIMIRILRHRDELLETDGAVAWKTLWSEYRREELGMDISDANSDDRSMDTEEEDWVDIPECGSGEERFQYCLDHASNTLYMRAMQRHSGGNQVDWSGSL